MKTRAHHNTKGVRQVARGKTRTQVQHMARRLGVPYGSPVTVKPQEQWATIGEPDVYSDGRHRICLWGDQASAVEGCDPDERVCRVRVEVLEVLP